MGTELKLTAGEMPVVSLLAEGYPNQEIAQRLGIAVRTVKAHLNRIFVRNGIDDGEKRVRVAMMAYRQFQSQEELQPYQIRLTDREIKTLSLIADGWCNREIAAVMHVTPMVLRNRISAIFNKIGMYSRLEAAIWFASHIGYGKQVTVHPRPRRYAGGWKVY